MAIFTTSTNDRSSHTEVAVIGAGTPGVTAFHEIRRGGRSALLIDEFSLVSFSDRQTAFVSALADAVRAVRQRTPER